MNLINARYIICTSNARYIICINLYKAKYNINIWSNLRGRDTAVGESIQEMNYHRFKKY